MEVIDLELTLETDHVLWLKSTFGEDGVAQGFEKVAQRAVSEPQASLFAKIRGSHMRYQGQCEHEPADPSQAGPHVDMRPTGGAMKQKVTVPLRVTSAADAYLAEAVANPEFKLADRSKAARVMMEWAMLDVPEEWAGVQKAEDKAPPPA
mmetsp:Transcript_17366/g.37504  ORF Transcript_17366/g.37504 Transcript_17366/m.37504 type:complete len:150 (-) Transcript_17366:172-621(-)